MSVKSCRVCNGLGMVLFYRATGDPILLQRLDNDDTVQLTSQGIVAGDELEPIGRDRAAARGSIVEQDGDVNAVNLEGPDVTSAASQTLTIQQGLLRTVQVGTLTQDITLRLSASGVVPGTPPMMVIRLDETQYKVTVVDDSSGSQVTVLPASQQWTLWAVWSRTLGRWRKLSESQHA